MARTISVEILGDASSLERAFKKSSRAGSKFSKDVDKTRSRTSRAFGGMRSSVLGLAGGFVGAYGLTTVVRSAFTEMADAQKVTAQTNAVLKSTGRVAGVSAKHVDDLSTQLMTLSGTDDEVIKSGENLLLTFTDIRNQTGKGNDVFDQATKVALDMSTALGQDMKSSVIQLGKALQDPIKGITALRRVGVNFTDAQKDQIKALVKSGQTMKAQKVILAELNREFGGSAAAAGRTLPGKLNILRQTLLNLGGSIAQTLSPAITQLVDKMVNWLSKSKNQKQVLDTVKAAAGAVKTVITALGAAFKVLNSITGSAKHTFELLLAAYITFKGLKLISYIAGITKATRALGAANTAATIGGAAGGVGGGRVGKAGKLGRFARLARFGRAIPFVGTGIALAQLPHPKELDKPGYKIIGDIARGAGGIVIHNFHSSAPNAKRMEDDIRRRAKQRAHQRHGAR